jgi:hypothetical protein
VPTDDFWPDVFVHPSPEHQAGVSHENFPGRVFLEILLILGAAALMVVATAIWLPIIT